MNRLIRAGALSCALASLAACNTVGAQFGSAAGSVAGAAIGAQVSPATISKAQAYAKAACAMLPAAESLRAIYAASNGTLATASDLADIACRALVLKAVYAADAPAQPAPKRPKKGQPVQGTAVVNGVAVPVTGTAAK